jgi:hypothetical protein
MGILDEAIRDHLELKRKGGTQEADLRRLEDEAFGPPGRPGEPAVGVAATAEAPETPLPESEPRPPSDQAPDVGALPEHEEPEGGSAPEGEVLFHDFAAEEGLVTPRDEAAPAPPVERETPAAPPTDEIAFDDTQAHDVETEIGAPEEKPGPPPAEEVPAEELPAEEVEIEEDLEITLDEEDEELVEGEIDRNADESELDQAPEDAGEDVLEETPDFLRETPESDRLWFEQKPPKDFDFDDD